MATLLVQAEVFGNQADLTGCITVAVTVPACFLQRSNQFRTHNRRAPEAPGAPNIYAFSVKGAFFRSERGLFWKNWSLRTKI